MAENGLKAQIAAMMDKAARSIEAARGLLEGGNADFSSSRSYYAAFYAIQALLLEKGLVYSRHAGVISGFSEHFIRPGDFPREYAKYISRLFRERHAGDYDFAPVITPEDAAEDLRIAAEMVASIEAYLRRRGLVGP